jgi:hypothetical protein
MDKDSAEVRVTLENSFWQYYLSIYLERSIRITAYLSNLFFLSVTEYYFLKNSSNNYVLRLGYIVLCACYGAVISMIAVKIVSKYYRPNFISEADSGQKASDGSARLVLSKADYSYRVKTEKLIFEIAICYTTYLLTAILLYNVGRLGEKYSVDIGFGLAGALVSLFNLFGVAALGAAELSKGFVDKVICLAFGSCFILPQIMYIIWAVYSALIR